ERRREVLVVVVGRTKVAAVERREVLRLSQVAVDQRALEIPGQAVVEREVGFDLPGVLPIEAEAIVLLRFVNVERGGLTGVADAYTTAQEGQIQQVGVGANCRRQVGEERCDDRRRQA